MGLPAPCLVEEKEEGAPIRPPVPVGSQSPGSQPGLQAAVQAPGLSLGDLILASWPVGCVEVKGAGNRCSPTSHTGLPLGITRELSKNAKA